LTDNGENFVSKLIDAFENAFKIKRIKTTSFHPQSNGSIERTHGTVKDMIRTCCLDKRNEWDENLKLICMGYNTSVHESTGFTPFELTFGRIANMTSAISVTSNLTKEQLFKL
jgi:transposase InsO family protein